MRRSMASQVYFNSNMVRLRAVMRELGKLTETLFQFQYGAIKGRRAGIQPHTRGTFQFQYGAIKGRYRCIELLSRSIFQFQYGAIKGCRPLNRVVCKIGDFNSNMVRLRAVMVTPSGV